MEQSTHLLRWLNSHSPPSWLAHSTGRYDRNLFGTGRVVGSTWYAYGPASMDHVVVGIELGQPRTNWSALLCNVACKTVQLHNSPNRERFLASSIHRAKLSIPVATRCRPAKLLLVESGLPGSIAIFAHGRMCAG
jgi:hypothetical protein